MGPDQTNERSGPTDDVTHKAPEPISGENTLLKSKTLNNETLPVEPATEPGSGMF